MFFFNSEIKLNKSSIFIGAIVVFSALFLMGGIRQGETISSSANDCPFTLSKCKTSVNLSIDGVDVSSKNFTTAPANFTLSWSNDTSNTTACQATGGTPGWTGSKTLNGSQNITGVGAGAHTYTISCRGYSYEEVYNKLLLTVGSNPTDMHIPENYDEKLFSELFTKPGTINGYDIAMGSDNLPRIAYLNPTTSTLQFYKCENINCTSGQGNKVIDITPFTATPVSDPRFNSNVDDVFLSLTSGNIPIIFYTEMDWSTQRESGYLYICSDIICTSGNKVLIATEYTGAEFDYAQYGNYRPLAVSGNFAHVIFNNTLISCTNALCSTRTTNNIGGPGGIFQNRFSSVITPPDGLPIVLSSGTGGLNLFKCGNSSCTSGNTLRVVDPISGDGSDVLINITSLTDSKPVYVISHVPSNTSDLITCNDVLCISYTRHQLSVFFSVSISQNRTQHQIAVDNNNIAYISSYNFALSITPSGVENKINHNLGWLYNLTKSPNGTIIASGREITGPAGSLFLGEYITNFEKYYGTRYICLNNTSCNTIFVPEIPKWDVPEVTDSIMVTVGSPMPALSASCAPTPPSASVGQNVAWTANASGGNGTYSYSWSGTDGLTGSTKTVNKLYSTSGTKNASVTITSGSGAQIQTKTVSCTSATVTAPAIVANLYVQVGTGPRGKTANVDYNGSAILSWDSTNEKSCSVTRTNPTPATIFSNLADAPYPPGRGTVPLTASSYTYQLTCINDNGAAPANDSVTIKVRPSPPVIQTNSCLVPGSTGSISWTPGAGTTPINYNVGVNDLSNGWLGCAPGVTPNTGDYCFNKISTKSVTFSTTPGHSYDWSVQACNTAGCSATVSPKVGSDFICPAPIVSCTPSQPSVKVGKKMQWNVAASGVTNPWFYWTSVPSSIGNCDSGPFGPNNNENECSYTTGGTTQSMSVRLNGTTYSCGSVNVTNVVTPQTLSVECLSLRTGSNTIGWWANTEGGTGAKTYLWTLSNGITKTLQSFYTTHSAGDAVSGTVTVTDSIGKTATDSCPAVTVPNEPPPPPPPPPPSKCNNNSICEPLHGETPLNCKDCEPKDIKET